MAGRKVVQPHLSKALKTRNHILDGKFSAKKIMVEIKKKKPAKDSTEDSSDDEGVEDSDGRRLAEKVRVSFLLFYSDRAYTSLFLFQYIKPVCRFFVTIQVRWS